MAIQKRVKKTSKARKQEKIIMGIELRIENLYNEMLFTGDYEIMEQIKMAQYKLCVATKKYEKILQR